MESLQRQLAELPRRLAALSMATRVALGLGALAVAGVVAAVVVLGSAGEYQYAYTNLSTEDSAEIAARLKATGVPFRLEAGGAALLVPAAKVYDVRLLLAADGLPRSSGAGFELFDKGDFGVSEFTQKVNLRRATEGELARTIGSIAGVRSARVHLVLAEKGVFKGDDRPASAAVMVNLRPGQTLSERELAGIRHLVASAVPGLPAEGVTIVDGRGAVLASEEEWGADVHGFQRKLERDLEQRVVTLLEPVVGVGQVVARVTATVDAAEVTTTDDAFDPDGAVLKSERTVTQSQTQDSQKRQGGVVGAAANQPLQPQLASPPGTETKSASNSNEETRNYEVSRTTTRTVVKAPRLTRLSVAVLLDGVDGKPRPEAEVQRLGELVRRAVGYDEQRGDQLEIRSAVFSRSTEEPVAEAPAGQPLPTWGWAAIGGGALLLLALLAFALLRRRAAEPKPLVLRPGARVADLEAPAEAVDGEAKPQSALPPVEPPKALADSTEALRERARELARTDPVRAAHLLRAWLNVEGHQVR
ncbi:MAG: flagellar basal-body MS-ring/collar protein FliF [Myxococcota bacterium]|jgi:flagellar M-ring protein FliF